MVKYRNKYIVIASLLIAVPLCSVFWFNSQYMGWLVENVPNPNDFLIGWQDIVQQEKIEHPAVIHYLPTSCLCRVLALKHAKAITKKASHNGFSVYQIETNDIGLGQTVMSGAVDTLAPIIAITHKDGSIGYVGAYSDGIRCNSGSSMVETFIDSPDSLPIQPTVGLGVETCHCQ